MSLNILIQRINNSHDRKMPEPEQKLFEEFLKAVQFDISEFLTEAKVAELPADQKKLIEDASSIMKDNLVGDIRAFGGDLKKNEEKFNEFQKKVDQEFENEKFNDIKKESKDFVKKLKTAIEKTCVGIMPVKELPWPIVIFSTVPQISYDKKVQLTENTIAFFGEIKCIVSKTTIYGKMKDQEPLFAPFVGDLDLGGYKLDPAEKGPKSEVFSYVNAIIKSLDSTTTRSQLAKYHEGYQRHGEPICDFLMKDEDLMKVMDNVTSGMESKRLSIDMAVCGIAVPQKSDNTSLMIVIDESGASDRNIKCFEALLKFSAACCEAPSTSKGGTAPSDPATGPGTPPAGPGGVRTPGGQQLSAWTPEELAAEAQKRGSGGVPPGMATWSETELAKQASERGSGLPEGMEVWKEEDLMELAKKRQGGALDIPEWEADPEINECANCGYGLRKGWSECPICDTPVGAQSPSKPAESTEASKPEPQDKPPADSIPSEEDVEPDKKESEK